jgi:acyl-coenzyme A synthetase/AMP-(fatty) acid ligase
VLEEAGYGNAVVDCTLTTHRQVAGMRSSRYAGKTVASRFIDEPASRHPDKTAVLTAAARFTYGQLARMTNAVANLLRALGCRKGGRVLLALPDSPEFIGAFIGTSRLGAVAVPVSPLSSSSDFAFYLEHSAPALVIAHAEAIPELRKTPGVEKLSVIVVGTECEAVGLTLNEYDWCRSLQAMNDSAYPDADGGSEPAAFLYTSGSTGRQKAAIHTHANLLAAAENVAQGVFGICAGDRMLSLSRLTFSFGLAFGGYFPLSAGGSTILDPHSAQLETAARLIREHRPTILSGVPSALAALLKASRKWLKLDLSSLRFVVSAGEPLPVRLMDGFRESFGLDVLDGLGSSEMITHFISNRPGNPKPGSCGTPVPGCDVKLLDEEGQPAATGEPGALWVKCETAFTGYWNLTGAKNRRLEDGWFCTGDRLYCDSEGFYYFAGRTDDMLKSSGIWVSSIEVEEAIRECAGVLSAAVTTRTDPSGIHRLVAYLVSSDPTGASIPDLVKKLGDRLPRYMMPAAYVVLDHLPLTINGKLSRMALPEPLWQGRPVH